MDTVQNCSPSCTPWRRLLLLAKGRKGQGVCNQLVLHTGHHCAGRGVQTFSRKLCKTRVQWFHQLAESWPAFCIGQAVLAFAHSPTPTKEEPHPHVAKKKKPPIRRLGKNIEQNSVSIRNSHCSAARTSLQFKSELQRIFAHLFSSHVLCCELLREGR